MITKCEVCTENILKEIALNCRGHTICSECLHAEDEVEKEMEIAYKKAA